MEELDYRWAAGLVRERHSPKPLMVTHVNFATDSLDFRFLKLELID